MKTFCLGILNWNNFKSQEAGSPDAYKYVCDFQVYWANGDITFEDVKGVKTPMYLLKKKQVEALYPITITEI